MISATDSLQLFYNHLHLSFLSIFNNSKILFSISFSPYSTISHSTHLFKLNGIPSSSFIFTTSIIPLVFPVPPGEQDDRYYPSYSAVIDAEVDAIKTNTLANNQAY
jgi:hypothetical protein